MVKEKYTLTDNWDYKGGELFVGGLQQYWDRTLLTKINFGALQLNLKTLMGPATEIKMNSKIFKFIETLSFYKKLNDGTDILSVYKVKIDDSILDDEILISHVDSPSDVFKLSISNY